MSYKVLLHFVCDACGQLAIPFETSKGGVVKRPPGWTRRYVRLLGRKVDLCPSRQCQDPIRSWEATAMRNDAARAEAKLAAAPSSTVAPAPVASVKPPKTGYVKVYRARRKKSA